MWLPPAYKGQAGVKDVGYGVYDTYDLGEFDQKGTVPTKYGTKDEYLAAIEALHAAGIAVVADIVLNHRMGGEATETVRATPVDPANRRRPIGEPEEITGPGGGVLGLRLGLDLLPRHRLGRGPPARRRMALRGQAVERERRRRTRQLRLPHGRRRPRHGPQGARRARPVGPLVRRDHRGRRPAPGCPSCAAPPGGPSPPSANTGLRTWPS